MFDLDEQDVLEIVKRQGELDIWHKSSFLQDQVAEAIRLSKPEEINSIIADQVLTFKNVFDARVKTNEQKVSQVLDEMTILSNKLNQTN